jgi:hypothetical protein
VGVGQPFGFDAGDANFYRYVSGMPVSATDPSGCELWVEGKPVTEESVLYKKYATDPLYQAALKAMIAKGKFDYRTEDDLELSLRMRKHVIDSMKALNMSPNVGYPDAVDDLAKKLSENRYEVFCRSSFVSQRPSRCRRRYQNRAQANWINPR